MKIFKDMDDNQYWATLWTTAATGIIIITTTLVWSSARNDQILYELVQQGHDPLELSCLFRAGNRSAEVPCLLLAQEKAKTYVTK